MLRKLLKIVPFAELSEVDGPKTQFQITPAIAATILLLWRPFQHHTAIVV